MCKYCEENESIYYDKNSEGIREVVVEKDNTLCICSNDYDREDMKKSMAIGFTFSEASKMAQYSISIPINYCPMCGEKLLKERYRESNFGFRNARKLFQMQIARLGEL